MILELIKSLVALFRASDAGTDASPGGDKGSPSASRDTGPIFSVMRKHGYKIFTNPGELNIVYIEGMNLDLTKNDNKHNEWNDLRLVLDHEGKIIGKWKATVNPGDYWVHNRMAPGGAANTAYGQYSSWIVGTHGRNGSNPHEALVQWAGEITADRDDNEDYSREGDAQTTGYYGINQHWGYDLPRVDRASAGCLVGQTRAGHREFMKLVKSDVRYKPGFVFTTTILSNKDF